MLLFLEAIFKYDKAFIFFVDFFNLSDGEKGDVYYVHGGDYYNLPRSDKISIFFWLGNILSAVIHESDSGGAKSLHASTYFVI